MCWWHTDANDVGAANIGRGSILLIWSFVWHCQAIIYCNSDDDERCFALAVYGSVIELPDRYEMQKMKMMAMANSTQAGEALIYPDASDVERARSLLEVCQKLVKSLLNHSVPPIAMM